MTTESSQSMTYAQGRPRPPASDAVALHAREVERLVAYLGASNRGAGAEEAEEVAAEAFLEVASTWPSTGSFSSPEVYVFACARRIAAARADSGRRRFGDALTESIPPAWDRADVARLRILQDALDQLPAVPRHAVLLREMCGFSPTASAEIIGLPASVVENVRAGALRTLVSAVESGTTAARARSGPLAPGDFAALSRALRQGDAARLTARRQMAERLAAQAPARYPGAAPSPTYTPGPGMTLSSGWSPPAAQTALDAPLSAVDLSSNVGTPIYDAISAWFASGPSAGRANSWATLDDGGWRAANARAAAAPEVAGTSGAGLPQRRPGANVVPSASDLSAPSPRSMFGEPARVDAGQVRRRLDSYQQGLNNARHRRRRPSEDVASSGRPNAFSAFGTDSPRASAAPAGPGPSATAAPAAPAPQTRRAAAATATPAPEGTPVMGAGYGKEAAFAAFYRKYLPELLAMLMMDGAPPAVAAEVAQNVLAEAHRVWAELDTPRDWARARAQESLAEWRAANG